MDGPKQVTGKMSAKWPCRLPLDQALGQRIGAQRALSSILSPDPSQRLALHPLWSPRLFRATAANFAAAEALGGPRAVATGVQEKMDTLFPD